MREEIVDFQIAQMAKERGFSHIKANCFGDNMAYQLPEGELVYANNANIIPGYILAPTQALLQKWLREREEPIILVIDHVIIDDVEPAYTWTIHRYVKEGVEGSPKKNEWDFWEVRKSYARGDYYNTYEKAMEEGLLQALKLIE